MVVSVDVVVDQDEYLVAGTLLPIFGVDGFRLHASAAPHYPAYHAQELKGVTNSCCSIF